MMRIVNVHALLPILLLVLSAVHLASGFSLQNNGLLRGHHTSRSSTSIHPTTSTSTNVRMSNGDEGEGRPCNFASSVDELIDRRSAIMTGLAGVAAAVSTGTAVVRPAHAAEDGKIVVFGGSGYVGSHVAQLLTSKGYSVVSVSRSSDQADKIAKILGKPLSGIDYVSLDASTDDLGNVLKDAAAVVSCVGVAPGGANQRAGNGAVNVRIANAAKAAGNKRFVYISVASELANGPAKFLLGDYLKGKAEAEAAVISDFGTDNSLIVKPAIIAGGPPGEIRPPGPPGVKPAAVEDVAKAVVAGALGQKSGTIDGNAAIATL
mmetsp:Transcript_18757/g.41732  ORF Transcript_18757/g.41732 Transcript_18757/m.41732 type:complete len:320 (+) Transcript_18757:115-1074(+)